MGLVGNLCNCFKQKRLQPLRRRMTRREMDDRYYEYYGYSDQELRDKEHNAIDLYQTAFGGVQSKCYCQSYSIDALCVETVNDVECLLIYSFNTIAIWLKTTKK